jgi:hypothetical protein
MDTRNIVVNAADAFAIYARSRLFVNPAGERGIDPDGNAVRTPVAEHGHAVRRRRRWQPQ